jgi:cation:H+ antiporter
VIAISLFLLAGLVLLFGGGEFLVRGAAGIGLRFGLSPLVVGLTLVAMATSSPELAVSLSAAADGQGGLALGNVVGSNICNIALIIGLAGLVRPLRVEARVVRIDAPLVIAASVLLVALLLDGQLGRLDGALLVSGLAAYLWFTVTAARRESALVRAEFDAEVTAPGGPAWLLGAFVLAGVAALVSGGLVFLEGAVSLATTLGVPPAVIGLTIAALGTSLPEIATSVVATLRGHDDIAVGNVVGSNLFNILAIAGVTGVISPFGRGTVSNLDLGVMIAVAVVLLPMIYTRSRIDRWEAGMLLAGYVLYIGWLVS